MQTGTSFAVPHGRTAVNKAKVLQHIVWALQGKLSELDYPAVSRVGHVGRSLLDLLAAEDSIFDCRDLRGSLGYYRDSFARRNAHSDQFPHRGVPCPQDVEPLTPRRRAHEDSSERPQAAEKRAEHEVSRVHEEDVTLTGLSGVQFRFQLGVEKLSLVFNVLGQVFFGRHEDRSNALPLQSQAFEESAYLGRTPTDASQLLDSVARLGNRADRLRKGKGDVTDIDSKGTIGEAT